jgi:SAM-dependent methyltransferase
LDSRSLGPILPGMEGYAEAFDRRGSSYDRAMRRHPAARDLEFRQVVERARLAPGMSLGDVPAGGGYLARHLPAGVRWLGHEPCVSFRQGGGAHGGAVGGLPLLPLPWPDGALDRVLSLAGVHHQPDKLPFHREVRRVLSPGGLYVLSDVAEGSPVSRFLDGYVGSHNSTGHHGFYLSGSLRGELEASGFRVLDDEQVAFTWNCPSRGELARFCSLLFDLRPEGEAGLLEAADAILGIVDFPDGGVGLRWSLRTVVCAAD